MILAVFVGVMLAAVAAQQPPPPPPGAMPFMPPRPPMPTICVDEDAKKSFLNESCTTKADCYDQYSFECKSGKCVCAESFIPSQAQSVTNQTYWTCVSAPYQYQECTDVCQKPYTCSEAPMNVDQPIRSKICLCKPPYIEKNGFCYKECKQDEIFQNGDCKKRCASNEIKTDNGDCVKIANLGEPCKESRQCAVAFSQCESGKCVCAAGFVANNKNAACEAKSRYCPVGEPVTKNNAILECKIVKQKKGDAPVLTKKQQAPQQQAAAGAPGKMQAGPMPMSSMPMIYYFSNEQLKDTCGDGQFCMLTSGESYPAEGASGHCCQKPKMRCPMGDAHPNATCGPAVFDSEPNLKPDAPYCPYDTHSCQQLSLGAGYSASLCCPLPCGYSQILVKDRCYPKRDHGDPCDVNEQCGGHNGVCEKGVCSCGKDRKLSGDFMYKMCIKTCKNDEVLIGNDECAPVLKIGDECEPQGVSQCPTNAYCSERKKCACLCGYVKLSEKFCAPPPSCSNRQYMQPFPVIMGTSAPAAGPGFPEMAPVPSMPADLAGNQTAVASPVQAVRRKRQTKGQKTTTSEFVFCKEPGNDRVAPVASVADGCSKGQFCSQYATDLGLCCPLPDKPTCPDGSSGSGQCDPRLPNVCGDRKFCYRYYSPAGPDDYKTGYVCCKYNQ